MYTFKITCCALIFIFEGLDILRENGGGGVGSHQTLHAHSQKRRRLAASCQFYRRQQACEFHQVVTSCKIRLVATCHPQTCYNLLKQLASSLWITSFDKPVRTTCNKLVGSTMLLQVVKTDLLQVDILKPASSC